MPAAYPFLDYQLPLYQQHVEGWKREERRLHGSDAVLSELTQWKAEDAASYAARQSQAGYLTFPKIHATTLTGHLSRETPDPDYGTLGGKVRPRGSITTPTLGEILHFNVDGVGKDGTELRPWFDSVQERALATGYRWVMCEHPSLATLADLREINGRDPNAKLVDMQDILDGFRPFAVEYSPIAVPFFQFTNGRLDFAVIKIDIMPETLVGDDGEVAGSEDGSYLLVRRGFRGLGPTFAAGGWWKFDGDQDIVEKGDWSKTRGQIPMFPFIGEPSPGTHERPAIARSLTMELGQIAVALMNRMSERNYNITFSAKSINYILGIDVSAHAKVIEQQDLASITVGIPPVMASDGSTVIVPQMWNSSAAAMDAPVWESVMQQGINEAREIMVKQISSVPDSSGLSKEAGFAEATSPLLARLAGTRQQAINTFLYFATLRFGTQGMPTRRGVFEVSNGAEPTANVVIPRDFNLQPVVDDIDAMLSTLKRSWLRSPTWEAQLLIKSGEERGLLPEDPKERKVIEDELAASATPTEPMDLLADDQPETPGRQGQQPQAPASPSPDGNTPTGRMAEMRARAAQGNGA